MVQPPQETMKAVVWEGHPYHVSVKEVPRPRLQNDDDMLVKLDTAAICGTDLHIYHGILAIQSGRWVLGHEGIGTVTAVGSKVSKFKVGDRVIIPDGFANGETNFFYGLGSGEVPFILDIEGLGGLQAEYARIPTADAVALKLPPNTSKDPKAAGPTDEDFVMLSDIFSTAWQGLSGSGFQAGDSVAVFGAGPVGLLIAYSALLRGASAVYVVDHVIARLEKAQSIGAIPIDLTKGDPSEQIKKLAGQEGVTRAIDAIGYECVNVQLKPEEGYVIRQCVKVVAPRGGIFLIGVYYGGKPTKEAPKLSPKMEDITFPVVEWWLKGATLAGGNIVTGPAESTLFGLIEAGKAKPGFVVDKVVSIDEVPEAYRAFSDQEVTKVVIKF